ncbi:hypothetical protein DRO59_05910 [Candidatus Bathyarchaeota archaeon]|nr:MAG: hypothetical protein DRO59_05910 [Candidatus Bathyarchaeota archaeon]
MLKKVRRRYLALKIECDGTLNSREFINAVWNAVLTLYGECGASKTNLNLIDYDSEEKLAVIRVAHATVEMIRAALASITRIGNKSVAIHVLTVSGTIKALHRKMKHLNH